MAEINRVDLGFQGGQVLQLRLQESAYKDFRKALESDKSGRWQEVRTEDSVIVVDLSQVVYVRLDTDSHSVGF